MISPNPKRHIRSFMKINLLGPEKKIFEEFTFNGGSHHLGHVTIIIFTRYDLEVRRLLPENDNVIIYMLKSFMLLKVGMFCPSSKYIL